MKKNRVLTLLIGALLTTAISAFATPTSQPTLPRQLASKIEQIPNNSLQIALFMEKLALKQPAKLANFLLANKFPYVYDESVVYIGVQGTEEVLVVCKIDDADTGTFYYAVHKKANRVFEQSLAAAPSTEGFATVFERK